MADGPRPSNNLNLTFRQGGNIDPAQFGDVAKECVLFYHPSCKELAEKVAAESDNVTLGEISWKCVPDPAQNEPDLGSTTGPQPV